MQRQMNEAEQKEMLSKLRPDINWIHIPLTTTEIKTLQRGIRGEITEDIECEIIQPKQIENGDNEG